MEGAGSRRITRRAVLAGGAGWAAGGSRARAEGTPTLDRLSGALVMMGFRGDRPDAPGARFVAEQLAAGRIGGVVLFEDNCASPAAVRRLTRSFAEAAGGRRILIGIDQEGGKVSRLRADRGFQSLPSADAVAHLPRPEAERLYGAAAAELRDLGVTINFAPVVDLDRNPSNPIIGALGRSYGADPATVIACARICVEAHRRHGVLTCLKHFPGHGSSTDDSHRALPDITRTWSEDELLPFTSLVTSGHADAVMVGHLVHAGMTEPGRPASLSRRLIETSLRHDLGFGGVVTGDDMQMGALRDRFTPDEAILAGLTAGLDLMMFSNREHPDPEMPGRFHRVVRDGVAAGRLSADRLAASGARLAALLRRTG